MLLFDAIASSLDLRRPSLLPALLLPALSSGLGRAWIPLAAALLGGALGGGALGCGSVVIEQDGSHASGGSAGGGAGAGGSPGTTGAGGGAVCPGGSWGHGFADSYKYEYGQSVAVDSGCHIVVSGSFGGEMDLGQGDQFIQIVGQVEFGLGELGAIQFRFQVKIQGVPLLADGQRQSGFAYLARTEEDRRRYLGESFLQVKSQDSVDHVRNSGIMIPDLQR